MENTYEELDTQKSNVENIYEELDNKNCEEHKEEYENSAVNVNEYENRINENEDTNSNDYINDYVDIDPNLPPPPSKDYKYEFEEDSSETASEPKSLAEIGKHVVQKALENSERMSAASSVTSEQQSSQIVNEDTGSSAEASNGERTHQIYLYVKAGSDRECIGCCPFSQRLFMMLWLKGAVFNVTTVDKATKPKQLKDIAAGSNPPFLLFNGEELTDVQKCEDYIEAELYPPRFPKLACKYSTSNTIGMDVFAKFSALFKFKGQLNDPRRAGLEAKLVGSLTKLNKYLEEPLDDEIDPDYEGVQISKRKFIDGDSMTIADCNILPKLNIIRVVGRERINFVIPEELGGIHRYLKHADDTEEFSSTCPSDGEIVWTYGGRKPGFKGGKKW